MAERNRWENDLPNCSAGDDLYSFHLVLFSDIDEMFNLWLPKIPEGYFFFTDSDEHRFLSISARNGRWIAVCKKPAFFRNVSMEHSYDIPLANGQLLAIEVGDRSYALYVEKCSRQMMVFHNYFVNSDIEISIGSQLGNDICCSVPFISRRHATLARTNGRWQISDNGSLNGVYVNGIRRNNYRLKLGDVVYIMGLRIGIGTNFFSINDGTGSVTISQRLQQNYVPDQGGYSYYQGQDSSGSTESYFNRAPRKRLEMEQQSITVEGPPMSMDQKQVPLMLRMGSSMVMGGAAALAGNFMTLISSVMFPLLSSKYTDKQRQEYERLRLSKYTEYLEDKRLEIENACQTEKEILNRKYPVIQSVIEIAKQKVHLWERRPVDSDFLQIRLGTGMQLLSTAIEYPARRFELEQDRLEDEMYNLVERSHYVEDVPIVLSLADTSVCGLLGQRNRVLEYIRQLILQIAVLHSYDEVKTVFFLSDEDLVYLDDIRYLPHTWDDQRSIRFIATDEAESYKLGEYIKDQISQDKEGEKDIRRILKKRPFYLIFALEKKLFESHEVFKGILQSDENRGISIITVYDDLPKESQKIIVLAENGKNVCTTMSADGGEDVFFGIDTYEEKEAANAMRVLANTRLKTVAQSQEIPKMVTFLEMFNTGCIEQLNPLKRWQENNPVKSLAAPVGVGADGSLFMLDLHEKRQGPHGLVAGMTGSGKSEFIITYILSMAVNYHPDEVAFVLIDYKGGGLAGAFENPQTGVRLPHLVGTITNLDGASIQRSLMSIESELIRRQKIFNEIKSTVNEGTMDIYAYQKLYRAGRVSEPMPHLFIISDEFAELKQQQPEFMAKLISAARIGRSLGVHLILATQKPSGVVDDQIRSNTKFRVCLRVQERSDSMDMLKRSEAAELTDTGRFYLQVGYNEYFALGQSAWCGAAYEPQDTVIVQKDDAIEFLDTTGQLVAKAKPKARKTDSGMKQIVAVVKYLSELANVHGIRTKQLWEPELPKVLDLESLQRRTRNDAQGSMAVCLGLLDDPENQKQFPLRVDFESSPNMLIAGDNGSGKTVLVQSILFSLTKQLTPKKFNFYVLDYSSRMLKLFKPLPHCGAVLQEEDSGSLDEFFKMINSLIAERKKLFSEIEVDSFEAARRIKDIPLILVVIDNFAGLTSSKAGETHSYKFQSYLKDSANYGIKYIVTCSHLNEVSSRIRQELGLRISLHLKDKFDYSEILGCKVTYLPPDVPGRGLINGDGRPLELQNAIIRADMGEKARIVYLKKALNELCEQYGVQTEAQQLPVISETATYEEFARQFKRGRIPLGYSKQNGKPVALPLKQFSALSLYFGNSLGRAKIIDNVIYAANRDGMDIWIVKRNMDSVFECEKGENPHIHIPIDSKLFSLDTQSIDTLRKDLTTQVSSRNTMLQDYCVKYGLEGQPRELYIKTFNYLRENTTPIMLFIESLADFCESVDNLSTLIFDKCFSVAQRRNIYVVSCFEPDDYKRIKNRVLYYGFNSEANIIMFGGRFDKQDICVLPAATGMEGVLPYNVGLMSYQSRFYPILMPCGEMLINEVDEDEQSIFGADVIK